MGIDEAAVHKLGNSVVWYIPLGLKNWFLKRGVNNVIELDWWQEVVHEERPDIMIACVPAMVSVDKRNKSEFGITIPYL